MFRRRVQAEPTTAPSTVYQTGHVPPRRERRRRRWVLWSALGVLLLLAAAGLVTWRIHVSHRPPPMATPAGVNRGGLTVAGAGPVRVDVYLDFLCPTCAQLDQAATPALQQLAVNDKITLVWHPVAVNDDQSQPPGYSTRAAAAAGCAADAGKLQQYGSALLANQPAAGAPGLSADQLIDLGGPIGLNRPAFAQCVRNVKYADFVGTTNAEARQRGITTVPTILIQDQPVQVSSVDELVAAINAAAPR